MPIFDRLRVAEAVGDWNGGVFEELKRRILLMGWRMGVIVFAVSGFGQDSGFKVEDTGWDDWRFLWFLVLIGSWLGKEFH